MKFVLESYQVVATCLVNPSGIVAKLKMTTHKQLVQALMNKMAWQELTRGVW